MADPAIAALEEERPRTSARPIVVALWGGALGLAAGVVLSLAFARPAGAETLPTLPTSPGHAAGATPAGVVPITPSHHAPTDTPTGAVVNPAPSTATPGPVTGALTPVRDRASATVGTATDSTPPQVQPFITSAMPPGVISATVPGLGPSGSTGPSGTALSERASRSTRAWTPHHRSHQHGVTVGRAVPIAHAPGTPTPVTPMRLPPTPFVPSSSQALATSSIGSHPFEGLPPTALLLPVLIALGLVCSRTKAPRVLYEPRWASPG